MIDIAKTLTSMLLVLLVGAGSVVAVQPEPNSQPWKYGILAGGNFGITWGDYYRGTSRNFGYDFSLMVRLSDRFVLQGSVSKVGIAVDSDPTVIGDGSALEYLYRYYDVSATRAMISLMGGGVLQIKSFEERGLGRSYVAVGLGAGIIRHEQSVGDILFPPPPDDGYDLPISDTQNKLAVTVNLLFSQMIGGNLGIYIAHDADLVFLGGGTGDEVHWRKNSGIALMDHLRFGLTALF